MLPRLTEAVELARRMARRLALRGQQEDSRLPGPTGWEDTEVLRLVRPPSDTAPRVSLKVSSSVNSWHCGKKEGITRRSQGTTKELPPPQAFAYVIPSFLEVILSSHPLLTLQGSALLGPLPGSPAISTINSKLPILQGSWLSGQGTPFMLPCYLSLGLTVVFSRQCNKW